MHMKKSHHLHKLKIIFLLLLDCHELGYSTIDNYEGKRYVSALEISCCNTVIDCE